MIINASINRKAVNSFAIIAFKVVLHETRKMQLRYNRRFSINFAHFMYDILELHKAKDAENILIMVNI